MLKEILQDDFDGMCPIEKCKGTLRYEGFKEVKTDQKMDIYRCCRCNATAKIKYKRSGEGETTD